MTNPNGYYTTLTAWLANNPVPVAPVVQPEPLVVPQDAQDSALAFGFETTLMSWEEDEGQVFAVFGDTRIIFWMAADDMPAARIRLYNQKIVYSREELAASLIETIEIQNRMKRQAEERAANQLAFDNRPRIMQIRWTPATADEVNAQISALCNMPKTTVIGSEKWHVLGMTPSGLTQSNGEEAIIYTLVCD